jgi:hypothetical protein
VAMLPVDEADLEFYFLRRGQYQKSTFGPMLERAALAREDSEGNRLAANVSNAFWRPDGCDETIQPHGFTRNEPSYTPDVEGFHRMGMVSRRLGYVQTRSMRFYRALECFYGDSGSRWKEAAQSQKDDNGELVRPGYGPGQIVALYALTPAGAALLDKAIVKPEKGNVFRTIDEHLGAILVTIASKPKGQLRQSLDGIRKDADDLLLKARSAYLTACAIDDPRRRKRIATRQPSGRARAVHFPSRIAVAT